MDRKIIMQGTVWDYEAKAPFTVCGKSFFGALEVTADGGQIKCHECGEWVIQISNKHLKRHHITEKQYRLKYGLRTKTSLVSPTLRHSFSENGKRQHLDISNHKKFIENLAKARNGSRLDALRSAMADRKRCYAEQANVLMNCRAQFTIRLTNMASRLGRTPTMREIEQGDEHGRMTREAIEWAFHMTASEALAAIGLKPRSPGQNGSKIASTIELEILKLRSRGLTYKDIAARLLIDPTTAWNYSTGRRPSNLVPPQA